MIAGMVPVEDAAEESILVKTARGAAWVISWRMLTRALGLLSTLVLARLLLPADFGLVTLAMGFSQAIDALSSLGVEEAVIREKRPSRALYDSAFTLNLIRGLATALLVAATAWPVARFFNDMRLFPVLLLLAAGSVVAACENIGIVDFRRNITFQKEFVLLAVPRLISIAVAIGGALAWRGYWALVVAILVGITSRTAMGYLLHPFRPRLDLRAARQIAGFSFWSWLLSVAGMLKDRSESFVIGRIFDLGQIGVFSLGAEIASLPTTELISPLSRACFSGFAAARSGDTPGADTSATFLRVLGTTTLIALPAGVGISLVADPIVRLAFGPRWAAAAGVIQVLGVALTLSVLGQISAALMTAHALLRAMLRVQILSLLVKLSLLVVLVLRFGLIGGAVGAGLAAALENLLYVAVVLRFLKLGAGAVLAVTCRSVVATLVMAAGLVAAGRGWNTVADDRLALGADLALAIPLGAVLYGTTLVACWWAAGRPAGAERDALRLLAHVARNSGRIIARQIPLFRSPSRR